MNILELKEATQEYVVYFYRPEGSQAFGEIRMDVGAEEAVVVSQSSEDTGLYGFNASKAVKECVEENNLPIKFTQAWV